uniref:NADH-ubiquinone oxidoreductase chain 1 n=1 Tax=Gasteruption tournieri TaxID=1115612 RepID=A0A3Q8U9T7_9HYME|nr:NADH dehydrogenase subunit 1 [Gasteruption tournieri]
MILNNNIKNIYFYNYYLLNFLLMMLLLIIMVLISVAFTTLLERKILGYIQLRKGPNKLGIMGVIQPFSDAIKLFSKESLFLMNINFFFYLISPMMSMILMLIMWLNYPFNYILHSMNLGLIYMFCVFSVGVYGLMWAGWSSNSMYSLLGSIRLISQTISYEVSFLLLIFSVVMMIEGYNFMLLTLFQKKVWFILVLNMVGLMFYISLLIELNRTPFDLAEGESELVSGFNTEFMSGLFALIFLAEYGMINFMSILYVMLFMGGVNSFFLIKIFLIIFSVIWIRGSFPRIRYDKLMYLVWKSFLCSILNIILFVLMMKMIVY